MIALHSADANASDSTVRLGNDNDTIYNKSSSALIAGKGGNDFIVNTSAINEVVANDGVNDSISGGDGNAFYFSRRNMVWL